MASDPVTPIAGSTAVIATGGDAVVAVPAGPNGGYIVNPYLASDQNISVAEWLYVDPVGEAILGSYGTTSGVAPGGSFNIISGSTVETTVNAATSGHRFTVVWY
jgi:hypothetical protein